MSCIGTPTKVKMSQKKHKSRMQYLKSTSSVRNSGGKKTDKKRSIARTDDTLNQMRFDYQKSQTVIPYTKEQEQKKAKVLARKRLLLCKPNCITYGINYR